MNMVLEKIRSRMETPCLARAWGHCLSVHTHVFMCIGTPFVPQLH